MFGLTPLGWLAAIWAAVTIVLIAVAMLRAIEGLHEENQIFLDPAERAFEDEQSAVSAQLNYLTALVRRLAAADVILLALMAGWVSILVVWRS